MAPLNNLRKKELSLTAEIVDFIPNEKDGAQKIIRFGSSNAVVIPNQWRMFYPDNEEVLKVLVKIKVPALVNLGHITYNGILIIDAKDFPLDKLVKK